MYKFFSVLVLSLSTFFGVAQSNTIRIYDTILFYDGYQSLANLTAPAPPQGFYRLRTSLYTTKLNSAILNQIGTELSMKVLIKASCDNYDRIGNVNLVFAPKSDSVYAENTPNRLEIARFITPFMNKNKKPDTVPYIFDLTNISNMLREKNIRDTSDIWLELEVFGVPYAANNEIAGCAGRNDVFYGTVDLMTNTPGSLETNNTLKVLSNQFNFNNYGAGASDQVGKTEKTIMFNLEKRSENSKLYIISSNHGANSGGEEYNRRDHFVYFDNTQVLSYKPGYQTCEPYRKYNTQGNGIYGPSQQTNAQWQSFSNWCPGAVIPIRSVDLGTVEAGTHTFKITVPTAVFKDKQGYIPLTVYFQGKNDGIASVELLKELETSTVLYPNPAVNELTVISSRTIESVELINVLGKTVLRSVNPEIDVQSLPQGYYQARVYFANKLQLTKAFVKQ